MPYTKAERDQIKRENPDCLFVIVCGYGYEAVVAIPKKNATNDIPSMTGMTAELLHGATIHLKGATT